MIYIELAGLIGTALLATVLGCWADLRYKHKELLEAISVRHGEVVGEDGVKRPPRNRTEEYMERLKESKAEMEELKRGG